MVPGAIIIMMVILIVIIYQKKLKEELIQVAIVIIVANVTICQLEVLSFKQSSTDPRPQFCFQL